MLYKVIITQETEFSRKVLAMKKFNAEKSYQKELKEKLGFDDYEMKTYEYVLELKDGYLTFRKPSIETEFCFGYGMNGVSTDEDSHEAAKMAHKAMTKADYFINRNMHQLEFYTECDSCYFPAMVVKGGYYNKADRLYIQYGNRVCNGCTTRPLEKEELEEVNVVIKKQQENFTKRINTYLKKYGLTKLHTWTYLVD